ncbi:MAG: DUF488 family protein [Candidatus Hydrogenedentes bacterium]|nr:DUF488 family protein [Candidatus Hydrogenedentota bacterium]
MIYIKRVYEPPAKSDGIRFLVERLWPRGVKKVDLKIDGWIRDVAPSTELRKWFNHDASRWEEFQQRYRAELDEHTDAWHPILETAKKDDVTLLFSSRDTEHNNVVALKAYLDDHLRKHTKVK